MRFFSRLKGPTRLLLLAAIVASLFSFAKFDHCRSNNWSSPDAYVHACYSDIPVLFSNRGIDGHKWAYTGGDKAVEYPVLTGAVMWVTGWLVPETSGSTRDYFDLNALLIAILFVVLVLLVWKMKPEYAYLLAFSPAMVLALYINWDIWGIVSMGLSIYYFDRRRLDVSAVALAVSISTKFIPVLLLIPIAFILWRKNELRALVRYFLLSVLVWLAINLPVIATTPEGWWHFYKLNLDRGPDWGSLWYALSLLGLAPSHVNVIALTALLLLLALFALFLFELAEAPTLGEVSFILVAMVLCIGKVYSPQYVLWLVPLAVLALRKRSQLHAFWIWQSGEVMYHLAIWQHLALVGGAHFGLPDGGYALLSLLRIATLAYFLWILVRGALNSRSEASKPRHSALGDFLFGAASSYP